MYEFVMEDNEGFKLYVVLGVFIYLQFYHEKIDSLAQVLPRVLQ